MKAIAEQLLKENTLPSKLKEDEYVVYTVNGKKVMFHRANGELFSTDEEHGGFNPNDADTIRPKDADNLANKGKFVKMGKM